MATEGLLETNLAHAIARAFGFRERGYATGVDDGGRPIHVYLPPDARDTRDVFCVNGYVESERTRAVVVRVLGEDHFRLEVSATRSGVDLFVRRPNFGSVCPNALVTGRSLQLSAWFQPIHDAGCQPARVALRTHQPKRPIYFERDIRGAYTGRAAGVSRGTLQCRLLPQTPYLEATGEVLPMTLELPDSLRSLRILLIRSPGIEEAGVVDLPKLLLAAARMRATFPGTGLVTSGQEVFFALAKPVGMFAIFVGVGVSLLSGPQSS